MKQTAIVACVLALLAVGLVFDSKPVRRSAVSAADFEVGPAIRHVNLTIFPVLSRAPRTSDRFITIDEGLANNTIEVFEVGSDGHRIEPTNQTIVANPDIGHDVFEDGHLEIPRFPDDANLIPDRSYAGSASLPGPDTDLQSQSAPTTDGEPANEVVVQVAPSETPNNVQSDLIELIRREWANQSNDEAAGNSVAPFDNQLSLTILGGQTVHADAADVNRLMVANRSDKPLYLMPGEILVGGQQDRTIAQETIIPPGGKPVAVDVFCVEHGRWNNRSADETEDFVRRVAISVTGDLPAKIKQASSGKFVVSAANVGNSVRKIVQMGEGQQSVWNEVASINSASANEVDSGTFIANYSNEAAAKRLATYQQALRDAVPNRDRIVGVIVAVNGKVQNADVFESTPLFRKLWPKLLRSYALDAANVAKFEDAQEECSPETAWKFFRTAMRAENTGNGKPSSDLVVRQHDADDVVSFSAYDDQASEMGGGYGAVHSSAFVK